MTLAPKFAPKFTLPTVLASAALALALLPGSAQAQGISGLTFQFAPSLETVASGGGSADYTGIFTNTTATDYYITLGDYVPSATDGSALVTGFFNGDPNNGYSPFDVAAGKSVTVSSVYTLSADPSLADGLYFGTVDFRGQTSADYLAGAATDTALGSADLTLKVGTTSPVPEASSVVSFSLLLAFGGALTVSRRRKSGRQSAA